MSTLICPLQHISGRDHDRCLRISRGHYQHWRQYNHQSLLCWWHWWLSRRGRRTGKLVECLDKASTAYDKEISAKNTKLMTKNTSSVNTEIKVNRQKLETVTSFKYLGSVYPMRVPSLDTLQDSTDNSSIDKVETGLERYEQFSQFQDTTVAFPCQIHLSACLWIMYPHNSTAKKNISHGNEVLPQDTLHLLQRPCYHQKVGTKSQQAIGPYEDLLIIVKRR